jgi:hypothetical protein
MEIPLCWTRTTRPTRQFIPVEILELLVREQTMSQADMVLLNLHCTFDTHTPLKLIYLHFCIKKINDGLIPLQIRESYLTAELLTISCQS